MPTLNIVLKPFLHQKAYGSSLQVAPGTIQEMNIFSGALKYHPRLKNSCPLIWERGYGNFLLID